MSYQRSQFDYPFPTRQNTMYLDTLLPNSYPIAANSRESSFLKKDIEGATPRQLISPYPISRPDKVDSTIISTPQRRSDPLRLDDIDGVRSHSNKFQTNRIVNPLMPEYKLPNCPTPVLVEFALPPRNSMFIEDILDRKIRFNRKRGLQDLNAPIAGSSPRKLIRERNHLPIQDEPNWSERAPRSHQTYQPFLQGSKRLHPISPNRPISLSLNVSDIQGASTKPSKAFLFNHPEHRTLDFQRPMKPCRLIDARNTNPLVPRYQYPGHSETDR